MSPLLRKILSRNSNTNIVRGSDGKFHTVYLIEFVDGHYYIGKHTSNDISNDSYICSGKACLYLIKTGISYTRTITHSFDSAEEAIRFETTLLQEKELYESDDCLNCYPGSPSDSSGTIVVNKDDRFKMINPKMLEWYLHTGWERGTPKKRRITKNGIDKCILDRDLEKFLDDGWKFGASNLEDRLFVFIGEQKKFIKKSELSVYLDNGWEQKHNVQGYKVVRDKDGILRKVKPEELEDILNDGGRKASTVENLITIIRDKEVKRIQSERFVEFKEAGWVLGSNASGTIYVNNGTKEKRIDPIDLSSYVNSGWFYGRIPKVYLNNGKQEKRIYSTLQNEIQELINNGWVLGKLIREKKTRAYQEDGTYRLV